MNPTVQTQFAFADPNANPLTINELIALLNTLVASQILPEDTFAPYVISHDAPDPDHQDFAWIQTDTAGNPIAVKTFVGGNWRRVYNGMMGEVRGFTGAPGYTDSDPSLFDTTGKGRIGLEYDGWAICNGANGTPNLTDRFLIGAHMDDSEMQTGHGFGGNGWFSYLDLGGTTKAVVDNTTMATNGKSTTMLAENNLPPLDNSRLDPATGAQESPGLYLQGFEAKDGVDHLPDTKPIIDGMYANMKPHDHLIIKYGPDPPLPGGGTPLNPQIGLQTLPPYYILAWITFIGY
jgi:hypothetical protein